MSSEHISITAHYTSYVWHKHHHAPKQLTTWIGALMYYSLIPANWLIKPLINTHLNEILVARHQAIYQYLQSLLDTGNFTQVIEIAAGLSNLGQKCSLEFTSLNYLEVDLESICAIKRKKLNLIDQTQLPVVASLDFLQSNSTNLVNKISDYIDLERPVVIITEGLNNYLSKSQVETLWNNISVIMGKHPQNKFISEIHLASTHKGLTRNIINAFRKLLTKLVRVNVNSLFSESDLRNFLSKAGITITHTQRLLDSTKIGKDWLVFTACSGERV